MTISNLTSKIRALTLQLETKKSDSNIKKIPDPLFTLIMLFLGPTETSRCIVNKKWNDLTERSISAYFSQCTTPSSLIRMVDLTALKAPFKQSYVARLGLIYQIFPRGLIKDHHYYFPAGIDAFAAHPVMDLGQLDFPPMSDANKPFGLSMFHINTFPIFAGSFAQLTSGDSANLLPTEVYHPRRFLPDLDPYPDFFITRFTTNVEGLPVMYLINKSIPLININDEKMVLIGNEQFTSFENFLEQNMVRQIITMTKIPPIFLQNIHIVDLSIEHYASIIKFKTPGNNPMFVSRLCVDESSVHSLTTKLKFDLEFLRKNIKFK